MKAAALVKALKASKGKVFVTYQNRDNAFVVPAEKGHLIWEFSQYHPDEETGFWLHNDGHDWYLRSE